MRKSFIYMACVCMTLSGCAKSAEAETVQSTMAAAETTVVVPESVAPTAEVVAVGVEKVAVTLSEADAELNRGVIEAMKHDIDAGEFTQEMIDALPETMGLVWLSECTDEVFIEEAVVEVTDYWNAKIGKGSTTKSVEGKAVSKPAESKGVNKAVETEVSVEKESQVSSGNTGGSLTSEQKAALEALDSAEHAKQVDDASVTVDTSGHPLSEQDKNIGMY